MNCRGYRRQFSPLLDGRLPARERERLERHLLDCPSCRRAWEELRELPSLLAEMPAPASPEHLTGRIMAAARERQVARAGRGRFIPQAWLEDFWPWPMRAAAGLSLFVGIVAGSTLGWQTGRLSLRPVPAVTTRADIEVVYGLDVLGSLPDGSLEAVMATMLPGSAPARR